MLTHLQDTLYGRIEHSPAVLALLQTKEMQRLRHISLSATPPWLITTATYPSRFEHSVGASYLASLVVKQNEPMENALEVVAAALAHDIATPPFSHLTELFMPQFFGKDHEEYAEDVLASSEFSQVLVGLGGDPEKVAKIIQGKLKPWSDLVHGSIDVDNLDNVLRYSVGMGILSKPHYPYSPESIARGFTIANGKVHLKADLLPEILGWTNARHLTYNFIGTDANTIPNQMVKRAIDLAIKAGEIEPGFFRLVDADAWDHLRTACNPQTRQLISQAERWQFHERVFLYESLGPSSALQAWLENPETQRTLADDIAAEFKLTPESVSAYTGKSRGYRQIDVPILNNDGTTIPPLTSSMREYWTALCYLDPEASVDRAAVCSFVANLMATQDPDWQNTALGR